MTKLIKKTKYLYSINSLTKETIMSNIYSNNSNLDFKDKLSIYLFIIPMLTRWVLPSSIELQLVTHLFEIPLYIPDICYIIFVIIAKSNITHYRANIIKILLLQFLFIIFSIADNYSSFSLQAILGNQPFIFYFLLISIFPFKRKQILYIKWPIIIVFAFICFQIILGSFGIVNYLESERHSYAGIVRVSTTIGGSTGSAIIILLLGAVIYSFYTKGRFSYFFMLIWIATIILTISRGSAIVILCFTIITIYKYLIKTKSTWKKISLLFVIVSGFTLLYSFGVFNPITERSLMLEDDGNITTGRDTRLEDGLKIFSENPLWGVGSGNVFPSKDFRSFNVKSTHPLATHNYFVTILAEQGFIGLSATIIVMLLFIVKMNIKRHTIPLIIILCTFISMNTESIFVDSEFISIYAFLCSISFYQLENE